MRGLLYTIVTVLTLFSAASCKNHNTASTEKIMPIHVKAVAVTKKDIREYLTFNGVTLYQKKEDIRSGITGYISALRFNVGDHIRAGQTFAYIRTKEQDALREAIKIDSSLAKFSSPLRINSSGTGILAVLNVQVNDYIAEGDVLATVVQPKSLVVSVNVPYEYEDYIDIGTLCQIVQPNEAVIEARISGKLPIIDITAQSQTFLIALPGEELPENLNVQVHTVYREADSALSIPHEALQTNELMTEYWVMKVGADSLAMKQKVVPLLRNDTLIQISSDHVTENDLVVTEGSYEMQDSTLVSIDRQ